MKDSRHLFAIYYDGLATHQNHDASTIMIEDKELHHRIVKVLRLREGETIDLFDGKLAIQVKLNAQTFTTKKVLHGSIVHRKNVEPCKPLITLYPSLLKRDDFEHVCSMAAVLGAHSIQPIITEKSHRNWLSEKDYTRLHKIMIAACEQSKNFYIPALNQPLPFETTLQAMQVHPSLYFDPTGNDFLETLKTLSMQRPEKLCLAWGPEGDLTLQEKELLRAHKISFVRLTPMILKSVDAITISLGALRSVLS